MTVHYVLVIVDEKNEIQIETCYKPEETMLIVEKVKQLLISKSPQDGHNVKEWPLTKTQ